MDNVLPEGTEDPSVTFPSGEVLGSNIHMSSSGRIIKSPQQHDPGYGAAREWNNDAVSSIVYMIQYGDLNSNVDTDYILPLLAELDAEYCMEIPSTFHMRQPYVLKS